ESLDDLDRRKTWEDFPRAPERRDARGYARRSRLGACCRPVDRSKQPDSFAKLQNPRRANGVAPRRLEALAHRSAAERCRVRLRSAFTRRTGWPPADQSFAGLEIRDVYTCHFVHWNVSSPEYLQPAARRLQVKLVKLRFRRRSAAVLLFNGSTILLSRTLPKGAREAATNTATSVCS